MREGERQVAETVDGIRRDHVARYEWAASFVEKKSVVVDAGCGIGYGSKILASAGATVIGLDQDEEAVEYARKHYSGVRITYICQDVTDVKILRDHNLSVAFEIIEHLRDPVPFLKELHKRSGKLLASVPNEDRFPWNNYAYHYRHYTKGQFEELLNAAGWRVIEWYGQEGSESDVEKGINGRTLIAVCDKGPIPEKSEIDLNPHQHSDVPKHVSILGLGPSLDEYTNITKRLGGRHEYCDETWAVNSLGSVIACDVIFHMDDVRIQEIRAKEQPESNIAAMLKWLKRTPLPVVTSRPHPDYPSLRAFPLVEVLNHFKNGYFNSTVAYMVAYAIYIGVEKISLFGVDFTYPDAHDAEKGRACVEYWLGMASARGIKLVVPRKSTLLDALHTQRERFYGYDTLDMVISQDSDGAIFIDFTERRDLPSAAEVESAYDHDKHPNALMAKA